MLLSIDWLKEDYGIDLPPQLLAERLTMAGLEVDSMTTAAPPFSGVVVAQVLTLNPHPDADKLRVATVNSGTGEALQIVCGAPNVAVGVKVPLATIGAVLPGDLRIKKSKLRGVESFGMLCSARELGLSDEHAGLLILPEDAPVGADIREYLRLNDTIIDIDLTPNRADCFSIRGLAREIAQLCRNELGAAYRLPPLDNAAVAVSDHVAAPNIENRAPQDCPRYLARTIRGIDIGRATPPHIAERLRRAGIRTHDPVVDITNYVMLSLGTPLHAFDADKVQGGIVIRPATAGETLRLLNDSEATLVGDELLIADSAKALAIAGVMGGADSACSEATQNIILEAAWFNPPRIAGKARRFGLSSDSAQRFERGVDYTLQETAIELAARLIVGICGGAAGAIGASISAGDLPQRTAIALPRDAIAQRIGRDYDEATVSSILEGLGGEVQFASDLWTVTPPAWRFDLTIAADLIEEIARIDGYAHIPDRLPAVQYQQGAGEGGALRYYGDMLVAQGFQEAVTYGFIDRDSHQAFFPDATTIKLQNPISANLAEMRLSLLPGLVNAVIYNRNRQQQDVRLFEIGRVFLPQAGKATADCAQPTRLAGVMSGLAAPEQWATEARKIDFFDAKAVVENLLLQVAGVNYRPSSQPYLHPGKSADIYDDSGQYLGCVGALHPQLLQTLDSRGGEIYIFELNDLARLPAARLPHYCNIGKFPTVRRDLALVVGKNIAAADLLNAIREQVGDLLADTWCFDRYQGASMGDQQSLAVAILLQDSEKTLQDEEVASIIESIVKHLKNTFNAELR
ncbi:MAG: phenylalanine--tRNA ligase subunit beta [Cardiobacterium sp.]